MLNISNDGKANKTKLEFYEVKFFIIYLPVFIQNTVLKDTLDLKLKLINYAKYNN